MLNIVKTALAALAFPIRCRVCDGLAESPDDGVVCGKCWEAANFFDGTETLCTKCGAFLRDSPSAAETFCRQCGDQHYDMARAAGKYDGAISAAVLNLKRTPHLPQTAGGHLLSAISKWHLANSTLLIPVPLSKRRERERGFNQAAVIARFIAANTEINLDERSLQRKIHTPIHRAGMDRKAREITVKNAFEVTRPKLIDGQSVLLIDDVFTSGATVSACSKLLKKHGALSVRVLTLGRVV